MKPRLLALFLLILMITTACGASPSQDAAASPTNKTAGIAADDGAEEPSGDLAPYVIDYFLLSSAASDEKDKIEAALNELIEPKINATIKLKMVDWASWEERALVAIQAGEKGDLVFTADWQYYMRSISQNLFTKLNDPDGPYGDLLNTYGRDAAELLGPDFILGTQVDGINYAVPTNKELTVPGGYIFNLDLIEKYGFDISTITCEADLGPWLKEVKEGEGESFFPLLTDGDWLTPFIDITSNSVPSAVMVNDALADGTDDPNIYYLYETSEMLEHLSRYRAWYEAGYIHPDAYLTSFGKSDLLYAGKFFVQFQSTKGNQANAGEYMFMSNNPDLRLIQIEVTQPRYITTHAGGSMLAIPTTSKDPARAMMFINLMHSDSAVLNTLVWGVEDVHYTKVSDHVVQPNLDNSWSSKHAGSWTLGNQFLQWVSTDENPDKYILLREFSATGTPHISLGFRFRPEVVDNEIAAVKGITDGIERSIKTGAVDPNVELPKMLDGMKNAGIDKILTEVRAQFTQWLDKAK